MQDFDPNAAAPPYGGPPTHAGPIVGPPDTSGVRIPILISGILNLVWAAAWLASALFTCFSLLAVPLFIALGVFELIYASRLGSEPQPERLRGGAMTLGILEIVEVVLCTPNFVCGIIVLTNLKKLDPPRPQAW